MIQDRIFTPGLAQVAYVVADGGEAAIIDPRRDIQVYLDWAGERDVRITAVLETHVHADFVSGGKQLAEATGATLYTPRLGDVTYAHSPLDHGTRVTVGSAELEAIHTPGHTPEHIAFLLYPQGADKPTAFYSGDALFVGDVGRPDLLGSDATAGLASQLFRTVQDRFKTLPDEVEVFPGHTAGSSCGKKIGDDPSTTIGREKAENYAFQPEDEESFVDAVLADMPTPPTYYPTLKQYNRTSIAAWDEAIDIPALTADEAKTHIEGGALLVDMRSPAEFNAGFLKGAIFAGAGGDYQTWIGWHAPYDRDLVLLLPANADANEIRTRLGQIGIDRIVGVFTGKPEEIGETVAIETIDDTQAVSRIGNGVQLLDVRSASERAEVRLDDSAAMPAGDVVQGKMPKEISKEESFMVTCAGGYRSTVVSGLLKNRGYDDVVNVISGFTGALVERAEQE